METYILRIYRRSADRPEQIVGVSEHVETGERKRFQNVYQLSQILLDSEPEYRQPDKPSNDA